MGDLEPFKPAGTDRECRGVNSRDIVTVMGVGRWKLEGCKSFMRSLDLLLWLWYIECSSWIKGQLLEGVELPLRVKGSTCLEISQW